MVHYVKLLSSLAQRLSNGEGGYALGEVLNRKTYFACRKILALKEESLGSLEAYEYALRVILSIPQCRQIAKTSESLFLLRRFFNVQIFRYSTALLNLTRECVQFILPGDRLSLSTIDLLMASSILLRYSVGSPQGGPQRPLETSSLRGSSDFLADSFSSPSQHMTENSVEERNRKNRVSWPTTSAFQLAVEILVEVAKRLSYSFTSSDNVICETFLPQMSNVLNCSFKELYLQSNNSSVTAHEVNLVMENIKTLILITAEQRYQGTLDREMDQLIQESILKPIGKAITQTPFLAHLASIVSAGPLHFRQIMFIMNLLLSGCEHFQEIGAQKLQVVFELSEPSRFFFTFTAAQATRRLNLITREFVLGNPRRECESTLVIFNALAPLLETQVFFTKDFPEGVNFDQKLAYLILNGLDATIAAYISFCTLTIENRRAAVRFLATLERAAQSLLVRGEACLRNDPLGVCFIREQEESNLLKIYLLQILLLMYKSRKLTGHLPAIGAAPTSGFRSTDDLIDAIMLKSSSLILIAEDHSSLSAASDQQTTESLLSLQKRFRFWGELITFCHSLDLGESKGRATHTKSSNMQFYLKVLQSFVVMIRQSRRSQVLLNTLHLALRSLNKAYTQRSFVYMDQPGKESTEEGSSELAALKDVLIECFKALQNEYEELSATVPTRSNKDLFQKHTEKDLALGLPRIISEVASEALQLASLLGFPVSDLHSTTTLHSFLTAALHSCSGGRGEREKKHTTHLLMPVNDPVTLLRLIESTIRAGICDTSVLMSAATHLDRAVSEDTLIAFKSNWRSMTNLVRSCFRLYTLAGPHLSTSKSHRLIVQQCLLCVTRLCLQNRPTSITDTSNSRPIQKDLFSRSLFAEAVWHFTMQAVEAPLRQCPLDKYLSVMLGYVRRQWISVVAKELRPPKSTDETILLENRLKECLGRKDDLAWTAKITLSPVYNSEHHEAFLQDLFIQLNLSLLELLRDLKRLFSAVARSDRECQRARMKQYYDVCNAFSDIFACSQSYMLPSVIYAALQHMLFLPSLFERSGYYTTKMERQLEFCMVSTLAYVKSSANRGSWAAHSRPTVASPAPIKKQEVGLLPGTPESQVIAEEGVLLDSLSLSQMFLRASCIANTSARRFLYELLIKAIDAPHLHETENPSAPQEVVGRDKVALDSLESSRKFYSKLIQGLRRTEKLDRYSDAV